MTKRKHITDLERMEIEHELKQRSSLKKIAEKIGKHHSSISREILARRTPSTKGAFGRITNRCISRGVCNRRQLCLDKPDCTRRCSACRACNTLCPDFVEESCTKLASPPYVCNGCADETACVLRKFYYLHKLAQRNYREMLAESREGANITEEELISLDELVSPLIRQGQSLHHILVNNPDCFSMNDKTLYRYVAGGLLQAKNGDMPRVCRLKPRAGKPVEHKVDTGCRIGRTYADYLSFMATAPDLRAVEMDSVIGRIGGKVLLTLMFPWCGLMLAFLRNRNDSQSVIDAFSHLWNRTDPALYKRLFPVLLGDNGSEFSNPHALEIAPTGELRTRVFYCDPRATNQKARIERNHEFIRMILPKGTSFDRLVQADINLMMSHINSYSRPSLGDKTPFDLFSYAYGTDVLEALGLQRITPNKILLKPRLIP